jgi:hypothetical protein
MEQDSLSISWKNLPWNKFKKKVFHLQCKIYEAKQNNNYKSIRRLQKLLIKSKSVHYLAVKKATDLYALKNLVLSDEEKMKFANEISSRLNTWKYVSIKLSNYFKTSNHDFNLFIKNEIIQSIWKLALEPLYFPNSFLQKKELDYFKWSKAILTKKLLKIKISSSFNGISHNLLMAKLILPSKYKKRIFSALKRGLLKPSGYTEVNNQFNLANLLTSILMSEIREKYQILNDIGSKIILNNPFFGDNLIICYLLKEKENLSNLILKLHVFLRTIGLTLDLNHVSVSNIQDGFGLKWYLRRKKNKKFFIYPSSLDWNLHKKKSNVLLKKTNDNLVLKIKKLKYLHSKWSTFNVICSRSILRTKIHFMKTYLIGYIRNLNLKNKKSILQNFNY